MRPLTLNECRQLDRQLRNRGLSRGMVARLMLERGLSNYRSESGLRGAINRWAKPSNAYSQLRLPDDLRDGIESTVRASLLVLIA